MITYHLLLARRHGQADASPLLASYSPETSALTRMYERVTGPECAAFAADFAELMFVSDGVVLHHHDFPDPKQVKAEKDKRALDSARALVRRFKAAGDEATKAKTALGDLKTQLNALPKDVRDALADEEEEAEDRAADEKKRREAAVKEETERKQAEDKARAEKIAAEETDAARLAMHTELAAQNDDELSKLCAGNKISLAEAADREAMIEALLIAAGFPAPEPVAV